MVIQLTTNYYNKNAIDLAAKYESISFEEVHQAAIPFLPLPPANVLDIGSGSGRDSAWFSKRGYKVTAVEPAKKLLDIAIKTHGTEITWVCDSLPELNQLKKVNENFSIIILSGVWMHIPPELRNKSLSRISKLSKDSGLLIISLRYGKPEHERPMYKVSYNELKELASKNNYKVIYKRKAPDKLSRTDVSWETVILQKTGV